MPAAIPAIAAVGGALISANASGKASKAQAQAEREAGERSDRQFDISRSDMLAQLAQQRADQAPWLEAGKTSLAQLMAGVAKGGEFDQQFQRGQFEEDPGYQFRLEEGQRGIENQARAAGGMYSGATLKALSRFNSGLASQEYGNWDARQNTAQSLFEGAKTNKYNRLSLLAGSGQTANNVLGQAGQSTINSISNLGQLNAQNQGESLRNAAEARASGYVAAGNSTNKAIEQLAALYGNRG